MSWTASSRASEVKPMVDRKDYRYLYGQALKLIDELRAERDEARGGEQITHEMALRDRADKAEAEVKRLLEENRALAAVRQRGCDCGDDDACLFVVEGNRLRAERDRLLGWAEDAVHLLETCPVPDGQWAAASDALRAEHRRALLDDKEGGE